jgi:hypothetical protein
MVSLKEDCTDREPRVYFLAWDNLWAWGVWQRMEAVVLPLSLGAIEALDNQY